MFTSIEQFKKEWQVVSDETRKIFSALTDESLGQSVANDHRTVGRMAWHIVQTIPDMATRIGLQVEGPAEDTPVPESADEIKQAYDKVAQTLAQQINANWNDETLEVVDDLYGQKWKRGATLYVLIKHEIHHRGQMTVLMRQAGLKVLGIYGPSKEEWTQFGMPEPKI